MGSTTVTIDTQKTELGNRPGSLKPTGLYFVSHSVSLIVADARFVSDVDV